MQRTHRYFYCFITIFFSLLPGSIHAGISGKVTGRVLDAVSGEPLIGVNVMVDGTRYGAATNQSGRYVLLNIPPGSYTLKIQMMGYQTKVIYNVQVSSDYTTTIDAKLNTEILDGEQVVVTAERPLIQFDLTSTAVAIPESRISELPAEEMEQFLKLQAGVTVDTKGCIHIRGGRSTEIAYLIDGIPVTDGFDRTQAIDVDNNSIQELQVISGTFNAEYGQAQSGIVNIITKKGTQKFSGGLSLYSGDYLSSHRDLFHHIENTDFLAEKNLIGRLSGPIPKLDGTFFLTSRTTMSDGWLYGQRECAMPILNDKVLGHTTGNSNSQHGDFSFIPMNETMRQSIHGNISFNSLKNMPISWSFFYNNSDERTYDHRFALLPDGDSRSYLKSWNHIFGMNYILSPSAFVAAKYSLFNKNTQRYLYENPYDRRHLFPAVSTEQIYRRYMLEGLEYVTNQSNNEQYAINNRTEIFKFDFTSQFFPLHLLKAGAEYKRYKLDYEYFEVINEPGNKVENIFIPCVDEKNTPRHDNYTNKPVEAAFYLQDKIEFFEIVINAGVRYDYFGSRGYLPSVLDQKSGNKLSAPLKRAGAKKQFSPRFGLAFPISDRGVIHFSYGHFTQIPDFRSLYWNSEYEIRLGALSTQVGNPDLEPERTVSCELGVQQQIAGDMAIYATVYFKDIKNLLGQEIIRLKGGQAYGGAHWDLQTSNKIENLLGIDFIGTGGVCVVGDYETVLITNDDGQTWRPIPSETHSLNAFNDVYFLDDRYGWIGGGWGSEAVLLQTEDSGETWIERDVTSYEFKDYNSYGQVDDNPNLGSLQQIYFYDRTTAIGLFESDSREISQYGNIAMNTEDGGESWFVMVHGSNEDYAGKGRFSILDENNVICTGYYGDFCFSENRGKEWYYADDRPRWWTDLVVGKNGQLLTSQYCNRYGWEEGDFTGYLRSSDYGSTWREYLPRYLDKNGQPIPNDNPFLFGFGDFISNNRDTLWLVQFIPRDEEPMSLTAFISTDFGLTYKEIRRGLNGHVNRFLTPDTMIGYTTYQIEISMGNFDTGFEFYCSFDGGETVHTYKSRNIWNKLTFTMWGMIQKLEINAHYFLNGHKGFIVGSDGNIIGTDDTGQSWTNIYSGVVEDLWDITFIDEKTGFVVGDFGRILKTVDGGKIWYKTNSRTQEDIFCIGFLNDREGWVGTENGLRYTTDAGETWNGVPLRYSHGPLRKIAFDDQGNSYAYTDQFSSFEENLPGSYDHLLRMLNNPTGVQKRASESDKPYTMLLSQNYPNPFNSSTQIEYVIPQPALVSLQIYNLQGQLVTTLVNETKESGYFSVTWNGCSDSGTPVSTGVYIYHLQCNDQIKTRKLLLLK